MDVVCADEAGEGVPVVDVPVEDVMGDMKIFDIGKKTDALFSEIISRAKTVVWNGPLGYTEFSAFRRGSAVVARAMSTNAEATTIVERQ